MLEASDGEIPEGFDDRVYEYMTSLDDTFSVKVDGYASLIKNIEATAAARRNEANRLLSLAKTDENKVKRLKDTLFNTFKRLGKDKVDTLRFKLSIRKNGGKQSVSLTIPDPADLPEQYRGVVFVPALHKLCEDLLSGDENLQADAGQYAELKERGEHLSIR